MIKKFLALIALATGSSLTSGIVSAATTGSQNFTVTVPQSISIVAPTNAALMHDESDNPQVFPAQVWTVRGNTTTGVLVNFTAATPFVHESDPTFKRNARLELAVGSFQGPASWTVTKATDETNYAANDPNASVMATSNGVGRANLNLTVSFVTDQFGLFAAGNYVTTIVGTVAAN